VLARALDASSGIADARALADSLTRVFYADLDGDDERDGRQALAAWIADVAAPETALFAEHRERVKQDSLRTEIDGDSFEALLAELDLPVRPKEFTRDDVDLGSGRAEDGSWAPGMALRTRMQLFRSEQPTENVLPSVISTPDAPAPPVESKSARDQPRPPKPPSKFMWFWAGFAVTFSLLLLSSVGRSSNDTPSDRKMGGREKPVEVPRR
jgi:hypothetical protein